MNLRQKLEADVAHFKMVKQANEQAMFDVREAEDSPEKVAKMETCDATLKGVIDRLTRTLGGETR